MKRDEINHIKDDLRLRPLDFEGGYYRETYRSVQTDANGRPCGTAILYMLTDEESCYSALHRLDADEIYHFYLGDPVELTLLEPNGQWRTVILGHDLAAGQQIQAVVPVGVWQGSRLVKGGCGALLGTTMAPGFSIDGFESGKREILICAYPGAAERIALLTRD